MLYYFNPHLAFIGNFGGGEIILLIFLGLLVFGIIHFLNNVKTDDSPMNTKKNFFGKLSNGDFGLAKTYWLYGVLVGFVVKIAIEPITSIALLTIVALTHSAYAIPLILGTDDVSKAENIIDKAYNAALDSCLAQYGWRD